MRSPARKNVLILATVSFVAMVTGVSLQLHLLSQDRPDEHDFAHCSMCQQLLTAPTKFIQEPQFKLPDAAQFSGAAVFAPYVNVAAFHHIHFGPRGPPSV